MGGGPFSVVRDLGVRGWAENRGHSQRPPSVFPRDPFPRFWVAVRDSAVANRRPFSRAREEGGERKARAKSRGEFPSRALPREEGTKADGSDGINAVDGVDFVDGADGAGQRMQLRMENEESRQRD